MGELIVGIKQSMSEAIEESFHSMIVNSFKWMGRGIIDNSYIICLTVCLLALLLYISGQRKAGKYVSLSFVIYFVLQALRGFVK